MSTLSKLLRIKQWIKNGFVVAPLVFSSHLFVVMDMKRTAVAVVSFCFISSAVYIINDFIDREKDAQHPVKKNRPIASGKVSAKLALILALVLLVLAIITSWFVSLNTLAIILSYFIMNILYTFWLKNVVLLDIMIIAMGFLLRVMAGATAISVEISSWIFLTTLFISLFIGFAKRRSEIIILDDESTHRPVLQNYTVEFLNSLIMVSVTLTIITYSLYTKDPDTISRFNTDNFIYTVPIVIYGIFRYLYLMYVKGEGGDPTDTVSKDPGVILSVLSYALSVVVIVLQGKGII